MKKKILYFAIICLTNCFSQNANPDLFQTWYLYGVQSSDADIYHSVSDALPAITPTLTISSDLSFNGQGACNTFNGVISDLSLDIIVMIPPSFTTDNCNNISQSTIENSYFAFLQTLDYGGWYNVTGSGNSMFLSISNPIFGGAVFGNTSLKTGNFDFNQISIYPNPANTTVSIKSQTIKVTKVEFLNSLGQNNKNVDATFENIQISDLSSGIYTLKIFTEKGIIIKKIVKQ
jgi:Secretion system C-terminal sorting domain/META domain